MIPFTYSRPTDVHGALQEIISHPDARFIGGGTNLVDLMKYQVMQPTHVVDITHLPLAAIETLPNGGLRIGALARNTDIANHPAVRSKYPILSEAILAGASPQLRNLATAGGNLMQKTRCYYYNDVGFTECNKRKPGSGCAALNGYNRIHAILGVNDLCIATNPGDMSVALSVLDAVVQVEGPKGKRSIPIALFHRLPGLDPQYDFNLERHELITSIDLPAPQTNARSYYLKNRDRNSYAFALVSVAAQVVVDNGTVHSARIALGGVAPKPWRNPVIEHNMNGKPANETTYRIAAENLLSGAHAREHNAFKIEMAKRSVVRALSTAAART